MTQKEALEEIIQVVCSCDKPNCRLLDTYPTCGKQSCSCFQALETICNSMRKREDDS